jgi:protein-disulfide isomerase
MSRQATPYILSKVVGLIFVGALQAVTQDTCLLMPAGELDRVKLFLEQSRNQRIQTIRANVANASCYRKLAISWEGGATEQELILTPDFRFIANDVIDTRPFLAAKEADKRQELRAMLQSQGRPVRGEDTATTTITIFSDFECPYCRQLERLLQTEILPKHGRDVKVVFRQFPLPNHIWAKRAAVRSACLYLEDQSLFWPLHDRLFQQQPAINPSNLDKAFDDAVSAEAGSALFRKVCQTEAAERIVNEDVSLGARLGVTVTPTMFINDMKIEGVPSASQIEALIQEK